MRPTDDDLWRGDGIADSNDFVCELIGGTGRHDRGLQAFIGEHLFEGSAHVIVQATVGGNFTMVERDLGVQFCIEVCARFEREILQADGKEIGGRGEQKDQILAVELEGYRGKCAGGQQPLGVVLHLGVAEDHTLLESGCGEQLRITVLRVALELDGLGEKLLRHGGAHGDTHRDRHKEQTKMAAHDGKRLAREDSELEHFQTRGVC